MTLHRLGLWPLALDAGRKLVARFDDAVLAHEASVLRRRRDRLVTEAAVDAPPALFEVEHAVAAWEALEYSCEVITLSTIKTELIPLTDLKPVFLSVTFLALVFI